MSQMKYDWRFKGTPDETAWPVQCECGHIIQENYTTQGGRRFQWCGFCQTRWNLYPPEPTSSLAQGPVGK